MGKSKAPKTPDYTGIANQQAANDKAIAQYLTESNRVNQVDPYGQTTWSREYSASEKAKMADLQKQLDVINKNNPVYRGAQDDYWSFKRKAVQDQMKALQTGGSQWTQTTTLTPAQQKLLEQQQAIESQQNTRLAQLLNTFKTPTAPTLGAERQLAPQRTLQDRTLQDRTLKDSSLSNLGDLLYQRATKEYGKRFADEEAATRASLANQGFALGSEGYQNTLSDFTKSKNQAYQDAALDSQIAAFDQYNKDRALNQQEYSVLTDADLGKYTALTGADLSKFNALSADDLNRYSALSSNDLNRYGAQLNQYNSQMALLAQLLGGGQAQGATTPQYQPYAQATTYQGADLLGAAGAGYQGALNRANASNARNSQLLSTAGTLGGAALTAF